VLHASGTAASFVSAFVAVAEPGGLVRYVNAGHPPPLLLRSGRASSLAEGQGVMGPRPEVRFVERRVQLVPGDALLAFSDGVTERRGAEGRFFGVEGIAATACALADPTAAELLERVFQAADRHGGRALWEDDATLLVVRRTAPS
jgi:serine phosphatase RsbU (regulator of sigma subunit)